MSDEVKNSQFPAGWNSTSLSQLINDIRYGKMPNKALIQATGYPIFSGYRVVGYYPEYNSENDIVVVARGVGGTGDVKISPNKCYVTNLSIIIKLNENLIDKKFFYYKYFLQNLRYLDTGSAQSQITISDLNNLQVSYPPLDEQKEIAAVLSSLDDKIELNQQINKKLEEIAQAIFKQWFIDFNFPDENGNPYRDSGGAMIDSELGKIPSGWSVGKLGDIALVNSGKRPKQRQDKRDGVFNIPLYGASGIMGYVNDILSEKNLLVIGRVGTHGIVNRVTGKSWLSDNTLIIDSEYYNFVYFLLKNIDYSNLNRGAVQPLLTQTDIKNYQIIAPLSDLIIKFEEIVTKLFSQINNNIIQTENLQNTRDTLLTKLMSGELRL